MQADSTHQEGQGRERVKIKDRATAGFRVGRSAENRDMSGLREGTADVELVVLSDLHFSHIPPAIRPSNEWYGVMDNFLGQLNELPYPQVWAGDILHHWRDANAELLNFMLERMPKRVYGIVGNHELPYHRLADIKRSPYWTLVESGKMKHLDYRTPVSFGSVRLHGFSFGDPIVPLQFRHSLALEVAVFHSFVWQGTRPFPNAPYDCRVEFYESRLQGYDLAFAGDNHHPFEAMCGDCLLVNCGTPLRRRADELDIRSSVVLLHSDGNISRHHLDVSNDKFLYTSAPQNSHSFAEFSDAIESLADSDSIDFEESLRLAVSDNNVEGGVRDEVIRALEAKEGAN